MLELRINRFSSEYKMAVVREDNVFFNALSIPDDLKPAAQQLIDYADSLKTESELATEKAAEYIAKNASEAEQLEMKEIFDELKPGMKAVEGKRYRIGDDLIVVDMNHTVTEDSLKTRPATFYRVIGDANKPDEIRDWVEPKGNADAFMEGDKVKWTDGKIYRSKLNFNLKSPGDDPFTWEVVE